MDDEILKVLPNQLRELLGKNMEQNRNLQELRMRVGQPLTCMKMGHEYFLSPEGDWVESVNTGYIVSLKDMQETIAYMSRYSLYAFEEELKQGYLTLPGGHRVGIAGKIVMDQDKVQYVKYIHFLNIRFSHEVKGCADQVLPFLIRGNEFYHTLIISPPKCGKTTLLRDLIRQISDGFSGFDGKNVGVVDERSEIAGAYQGIPQNDVGFRTDLMDGCPKAIGMMMLIRSMAPDVVAVDEVGDERDGDAILNVRRCGCKLLATVHGSSLEDVLRRPLLKQLAQNCFFERYVVMDREGGPGHVRDILDEHGERLKVLPS